MSSPIRTQTSDRDRSTPVVRLDELNVDELRLVASFVELVRNWRDNRDSATDEFQLLWHRMKAKGAELLDDDAVMGVALEAQRAVRRAPV